MSNVSLPSLDKIMQVVEQMELDGEPVTATGVAKRHGWPVYYCSSALRLMGKAKRPGRQPVDYGRIRRDVAQAIAQFLLEERHFDEDDLMRAANATRWAVSKVMKHLGIKLGTKVS